MLRIDGRSHCTQHAFYGNERASKCRGMSQTRSTSPDGPCGNDVERQNLADKCHAPVRIGMIRASRRTEDSDRIIRFQTDCGMTETATHNYPFIPRESKSSFRRDRTGSKSRVPNGRKLFGIHPQGALKLILSNNKTINIRQTAVNKSDAARHKSAISSPTYFKPTEQHVLLIIDIYFYINE